MADAMVDTSLMIDIHRQLPSALEVYRALTSRAITGSACAVTVAELWRGNLTRDEEALYESLLELLEDAPLTRSAARTAGLWLRRLAPDVAPRLFGDALIGATAQERSEPVLTRNVRDFQRFGVATREY